MKRPMRSSIKKKRGESPGQPEPPSRLERQKKDQVSAGLKPHSSPRSKPILSRRGLATLGLFGLDLATA